MVFTMHQAKAYSSRKRIERKRDRITRDFWLSIQARGACREVYPRRADQPVQVASPREGTREPDSVGRDYLLSAGLLSAGLAGVAGWSFSAAFFAHFASVLRKGYAFCGASTLPVSDVRKGTMRP